MSKRKLRRLIKLPAVKAITALGTTKIYELEGQGKFPKRVKLTPRSVAWVEDEIAEFNEALIAGKSDAELRELVARMVADRQQESAA